MIDRAICHAIWRVLIARLRVFAVILEGFSEVLEILVDFSRGVDQ